MIKFFRKIRHRLLSENRFSKYLIYAVGEIFLVVIGILIALSISNWNESKKEENIVRASLAALKLNLKEDIIDLQDQIAHNEKVVKQVDFCFKLISLPEYENRRLSLFVDSIAAVADERTFLPKNTAFKSMESGAHFQWIDSQILTESIYTYYALLDVLSNITVQNNQYVKKHVEGFTYQEMEFGTLFPGANPYANNRNLLLDNTNILRGNHVFENALIGRLFRSGSENARSENAILKAYELIEIIDAYLEDKR